MEQHGLAGTGFGDKRSHVGVISFDQVSPSPLSFLPGPRLAARLSYQMSLGHHSRTAILAHIGTVIQTQGSKVMCSRESWDDYFSLRMHGLKWLNYGIPRRRLLYSALMEKFGGCMEFGTLIRTRVVMGVSAVVDGV